MAANENKNEAWNFHFTLTDENDSSSLINMNGERLLRA